MVGLSEAAGWCASCEAASVTTTHRCQHPLRAFRPSWPAALALILLGGCGESATEKGPGGSGGSLNSVPTGGGGTGAGGSAAGSGGLAGLAGFPTECPRMGSFPGPIDPCAGCYGLTCEPDQTCHGDFHIGKPASSSCVCVDGQMVCCTSAGNETWCNYGGQTPPQCPVRTPQQDEPCGPTPQVCNYPRNCEVPAVQMFCAGQTWTNVGGGVNVGGAPQQPTAPCLGAAGNDGGEGGAGGAL